MTNGTCSMKKTILINDNPWQTRIAILRENELQNIYFSAHASQSLERSFIKGKVSKILPGIQTAFVDIGQDKAGFLHISEIDRELAIKRMSGHDLDEIEEDETHKPEPLRRELDISKILKEGEHILVQVNKEPIYEKGAKLTTCFTLPGRFLVLMPNIPRIGISKKIEEKEERQRLRELLLAHLPEGMGAIIRTTSEHQGAHEILQDLNYLLSTWNEIKRKFNEAETAQTLYEDLDMTLQAVRDHLDFDVEAVVADNKETQNRIYKFVKNIAPEYSNHIRFYDGPIPLFEKYHVEKQIEEALQKKVHLKSGGSLVIETAEAMTVIDVNTGRYTGAGNLEETMLNTNIEAAEEIVRQLRLRNIGGLIVIDFIDMATVHNRQKLFKFLEKTLKERDKFQSVVLKVSEFGLVQMTRKRSGKTLLTQMMEVCHCCRGLGFTKSLKTLAYTILRALKEDLMRKKIKGEVTLEVNKDIFHYITTVEYASLLKLEKEYQCALMLTTVPHLALHEYHIGLSH